MTVYFRGLKFKYKCIPLIKPVKLINQELENFRNSASDRCLRFMAQLGLRHPILRVVHRGSTLFLKPISERGGSDKARLSILNDLGSKFKILDLSCPLKFRVWTTLNRWPLFSDPHPRFIWSKAIGFSFVFVLIQAKTIEPIRMRSFKMKKAKNSNDQDWRIKSTLESAHFSVAH